MSFGDIFSERPTVQGIEMGRMRIPLTSFKPSTDDPALPLSTRMRAAQASFAFMSVLSLAVTAVVMTIGGLRRQTGSMHQVRGRQDAAKASH